MTSFPIGAQITLAELEGDVHTVHHRLRPTEPVSWLPAIQAWLITDRELNIEVMRDAKTYTVDHPGFSTGQVVGPSMLSLDGPEHLRHRTPFERPFRKREVHTRFTESVTDDISQLIDRFIAHGKAELRRDFAGPIASQTMVRVLGLENTPVTAVLTWYDTIVEAVTRVTAGEAVSAEGKEAFATLKEHLLPSLKKRESNASLLAAASGVAQGLTDDQIVSNAAVLLFGGIETTEGMIANALYHLLTSSDTLAQVKADDSLLPAVIEESLRLEPAASVVDRYTTCDVILGGASIKEGDLVRVSLAGANRDPAVFPNPDRFDPTRKNLRAHVTWAYGPHVCLGLHLARLETQQALQQILDRCAGLRLVDQEAARPRGLVFRKPAALQAVWDY